MRIFKKPIAKDMAAFLKSKKGVILDLVNHAENLACLLQKQPLEFIVCHADIHGWNLLLDEQGVLYR